jgi:hypothetical protein
MKFGSAMRLATALVAASAALGGCSSLRSAIGSDKQSPDEFAVVTKAPLIIPPDYNLMPPRPGAPPTNQVSPTEAAQTALFNADPVTVAAQMPGTMSMGEKILLATAGAADADSSIRQVIAAENRNMQAANDSFTNDLMFWQKSTPTTDPAVDADAEARKMSTTPQQPAQPAPQKDSGANNGN